MGKLIKFVIQLGVLAMVVSIFGRIVFSLLEDMFFGLFGGLYFGLFPLLFVGIFIVALVKMLSTIGNNHKSDSKSKGRQVKSVKLSKFLNEVEIRELEISMRDFFKNSDRITIRDELYLMPRDGVYKNLESLELWFKGEAVATLGTLAEGHQSKCVEITDFLTGKNKSETFAARTTTSEKNQNQMSRAQEYIKDIDSINKGISDAVITANLHTTTSLLRAVHEMEIANPTSEKLRKLYDQYLPILMSTLTKFMRLSEIAPLSRDYVETKSRLAETVELINEAMKNISSEYYGGEMTEINVESKTLQSILKKDGVVGSDFIFPERLDEIAEEDHKDDNQLGVL